MRLLAPVAAMLLASSIAQASDRAELAQQAELERVRAQVADQVQLAAYDLIDELVVGWTLDPVFDAPTPVVLAGVTVPVGLGTGMQALLENHLAAALTHHPTSRIRLVHCPRCTAVVVHSGPEGTVVSRGIDNPALLEELGGDATSRHALFVDVEAEGSWLVLRARLTRMTPDLPIVWSHTLAHATSAPSLLRHPEDLKSVTEARQEYLDALRSRGLIDIPVRFGIRTFAQPDNDAGIPPPPFLWLQTGVEMSPTHSRAWTSSLLVGYSFIPQAYQGIMAQTRVNRLLTGRVRSLTRPDLYGFVGASVTHVWGLATASFRKEMLSSDDILALATGQEPRAAYGTLQVGLDLRVGNRLGMSVFLETIPDLAGSPHIGNYLNVFSIQFQSIGTEATFWF